jgi:hypothetical protein
MTSRQAKSSTFGGDDAASRQSGYAVAAEQQQHRPEQRVVPMRPRPRVETHAGQEETAHGCRNLRTYPGF